MAILFDGAYQYLLKGGRAICPTDEAALPCRATSRTESDIFAPRGSMGWAFHAVGYQDEEFTYSGRIGQRGIPAGVPGSAISVTNANNAASSDRMDDAEFHVRRLLFELSEDDTVTGGTVLRTSGRLGLRLHG